MPIFLEHIFFKCCTLKLLMRIAVSNGYTPTADICNITALNENLPETRHTRDSFILRLQCSHIDTAVVHVLIIHISIDIMDFKIFQRDATAHTFVFGNNGYTGALHLIAL